MPVFKDLTQDDRKKIRELYLSNISTAEIAKIFGVSKRSMQDWVIWLGISRGRRKAVNERLSEDEIKQVIAMRKGGALIREIANEFGLSMSTAGRLVKKCRDAADMDCYSPAFKKLPKEQIKKMGDMLRNGEQVTQVAKRFNISVGTMYYWRKAYFSDCIPHIPDKQNDNRKSIRQTMAGKDEELAKRMKRLSMAGKTNREIAKTLRVPEKLVIAHIGISGYRNDVKLAKSVQVLPVGERVWALQPVNTASFNKSYEEVPATIEKVHPRIYDCVTDNGYHVSVQIADAKRVMQ